MSQLFHFQDVKPIACTYGGCPHRFSTRSDLKDHINKNHTCQKPHQCENCGQCFATRSERSSHKRIHINEKKYQCEFCSKSFARSSGLSNHVRVHSRERPYKCNRCRKDFNQASSLGKHMNTHKFNIWCTIHHGNLCTCVKHTYIGIYGQINATLK